MLFTVFLLDMLLPKKDGRRLLRLQARETGSKSSDKSVSFKSFNLFIVNLLCITAQHTDCDTCVFVLQVGVCGFEPLHILCQKSSSFLVWISLRMFLIPVDFIDCFDSGSHRTDFLFGLSQWLPHLQLHRLSEHLNRFHLFDTLDFLLERHMELAA